MRGSIVKKSNSYYVVVDLPARMGSKKRNQKWIPAGKTKKEAEKVLIKVLSEINQGTFNEPSSLTLAQYLDWWLTNHCKPNQSVTTYESYVRNVNKHICPELGLIKLADLKPIQIDRFYGIKLKEGKSPTTVVYYHRIIHAALSKAVKLQILAKNPADCVDPPHKAEFEATVLNPAQVKILIIAAYAKELYIPVLLAITTGMRRGEILGLPWKYVDLENNLLIVKQELITTDAGPEFKAPKSKSSLRTIALPEYTAAELRYYKNEQTKRKFKLGSEYHDNDLVCAKANGDYFHPGTFSHNFAVLVEKADIPNVRFHDLRHSHASLLAQAGIRGKDLQEHMGHASMAFTYNRYVKNYEGSDRRAADIMDGLIQRESIQGILGESKGGC